MNNKWKWLLLTLAITLILVFSVPVAADSYKTVNYNKGQQFGSYYIWRPYNNEFYIQKDGSSTVRSFSINKYAYATCGVANGTTMYCSVLHGKWSGEVDIYKCNLKTLKARKIGKIKDALHIEGCYNGCLYGNNADEYGHSSDNVYSYNLKTKKKKTILKGYWLGKADGKYLYLSTGSYKQKKYVYNLSTKKRKKLNWQY